MLHGQAAEFVEKEVLESYCWMYSSWNIPPQYKGACSSSLKTIPASTVAEYKVPCCTVLHCDVM